MGKMLFMLKDPRPAVARVVLVSLLLGIPGRPAYAAAAAVARGAHLSGPGLAVPGKYSLAPLGVLTPTSVSISPMILPPLAPTLTPAAARPTPVAAAVPVVPASAPGARALPAPVSPEKALDSLRTSAAQTAADRATPEVFDGRTARSAVAGDEQVAVAITGGGASTARLAPASAGAARALPTAFVPATVIVAALEKAARTDPERGYLRAVEILEARTAMSREPKLAALKVLSALPLDRTLPYFLQVLKNASAGESTKVRNGDKNLYYIQRAMLHRMAADPRALSASPEALAVLPGRELLRPAGRGRSVDQRRRRTRPRACRRSGAGRGPRPRGRGAVVPGQARFAHAPREDVSFKEGLARVDRGGDSRLGVPRALRRRSE